MDCSSLFKLGVTQEMERKDSDQSLDRVTRNQKWKSVATTFYKWIIWL